MPSEATRKKLNDFEYAVAARRGAWEARFEILAAIDTEIAEAVQADRKKRRTFSDIDAEIEAATQALKDRLDEAVELVEHFKRHTNGELRMTAISGMPVCGLHSRLNRIDAFLQKQKESQPKDSGGAT